MKEAIGTVVCKLIAGSGFLQPAVELADGTWYWISRPQNTKSWPADPGQRVCIRFVQGDQFCEVVEAVAPIYPIRGVKVGDVVRYVRTVDPGDEECRFVVTEDNGDRLMIKLLCDLSIPPVCVVPRCEVTACDQDIPKEPGRHDTNGG